MLDLDALAAALAGEPQAGRVLGDEARREVTDLIHEQAAEMVERDGLTRNAALTQLLEVHRRPDNGEGRPR